ncbi:TolC family outer membrane protein [Primorskyibacter flagellatus]|uniref:Outer membrane protein n=1 Tax=Primorskyibacter flagellatus TaxID=1387277 RepID=A0A1W2B8J7_9RHOB|nr:TolC family outer membrane protein [Primorskyibacter flagellatus]SMC69307.1 outer membrane protein [Primorskyibacter flagellatus]
MVGTAFKKKLAVGLAALVLATPGATSADTLADALVGAYNTSGLLEQNRALLRAADEDVAAAYSALRPVVDWTARINRTFGNSASANSGFRTVGSSNTSATYELSIQLTLLDFGRTRLAIDSAKESVLAAREGLVTVEQNVLLRAVEGFMGVRSATETVALRQNNVRLITQELRAANDRFEVGEVTRTDVALAEAQLAGARSALASAQGTLAQAQEEYVAAVGRRPDALVPPRAIPDIPASLDRAKALAVRNHPDMKKAQREVTVAELNIQRAKAEFNPTVTLNGSYGVTENFQSEAQSYGGNVGVTATSRLYQGGRRSALLRQAQARRDAARSNLHVVQVGLQQAAGNAWAFLQSTRAARDASARQIRAATVAFNGVREEAKLGARTTLDVLNAEQDLLDARATLITATTDEYVAAYTLLYSAGLLTAEHLNLGVQQYDPSAYYNLVKDAPHVSQQGKKLDRVLKALGKN